MTYPLGNSGPSGPSADIGRRVQESRMFGGGLETPMHWKFQVRVVDTDATGKKVQLITSRMDVSFMSVVSLNTAFEAVLLGQADVKAAGVTVENAMCQILPGQSFRVYTDSVLHARNGMPLEVFDASQFWVLNVGGNSIRLFVTTAILETRP